MPGSLCKIPVWLPIVILFVAMALIQGGTSLAKLPLPLVGIPGVAALRLVLGTLILIAFFKPWRLRPVKEQRLPLLFYGIPLGGMNYFLYLFIQAVPLGIAVAPGFIGLLTVALFSFRRPIGFVWVVLVVLGLWSLLLLGQGVPHADLTGYVLVLGAGACWAIYTLSEQRAGVEHGPATVTIGPSTAALIFVPVRTLQADEALWHWSIVLLGLAAAIPSTTLPYSLEMATLTRLSTRTFGTLMSMEPALVTVSGIILLGEMLTPVQLLALGAIIVASMGSTLTIRKESRIKELDINQIYISTWLCIITQIFSLLLLRTVFIYQTIQKHTYSGNS